MHKIGRINLTSLRDSLVVVGLGFETSSPELLCLCQGSVPPCKWGRMGKKSVAQLPLFLAQCQTEFMDILNTADWVCLSKGQTCTLFCLCCCKEPLAWEQERQLSTVWVLRHERQKVICQRPEDTYEDLSYLRKVYAITTGLTLMFIMSSRLQSTRCLL